MAQKDNRSMIEKLKPYQRMYQDVYRRVEKELEKARIKIYENK